MDLLEYYQDSGETMEKDSDVFYMDGRFTNWAKKRLLHWRRKRHKKRSPVRKRPSIPMTRERASVIRRYRNKLAKRFPQLRGIDDATFIDLMGFDFMETLQNITGKIGSEFKTAGNIYSITGKQGAFQIGPSGASYVSSSVLTPSTPVAATVPASPETENKIMKYLPLAIPVVLFFLKK